MIFSRFLSRKPPSFFPNFKIGEREGQKCLESALRFCIFANGNAALGHLRANSHVLVCSVLSFGFLQYRESRGGKQGMCKNHRTPH